MEDNKNHSSQQNSPPKLTLGRVSKVVGENDGTEFENKNKQSENSTVMKEFDKSAMNEKSETK
jgi:hypothetical protein